MWKLLREYATSVSGLTQSRPRLSCTNNNLQPPKQSRFHSGRLSDKFSEKEACLCCFKMGTVDLGEAFIHRPVTLRQHLVTFAVEPTSNATPCERFLTTSCVSWKARGTVRPGALTFRMTGVRELVLSHSDGTEHLKAVRTFLVGRGRRGLNRRLPVGQRQRGGRQSGRV